MHAPANDYQEEFLEHEAELLIHNCSHTYNQTKMREAVIGWVNTQVNHSGYEVTFGGSGFTIFSNNYESDHSWSEADELCELIESKK